MRSSTAARIADLPQLVTRSALHAAGMDLDVALRAAGSGQWRDVLPGAWLRLDREVTRADRQRAALELLGDEAVLSGADACQHYGLRDVPDDGRVCVLVPHAVRRDLGPAVRLVRTTAVVPRSLMRGRRWAPPVRAVVDAAHEQDLRAVRALVTAAVADRWSGADELRHVLDNGPRRGSAHLRRALADVDAGARSAPEAEAADVLSTAVRRGRLPPFLLNPDLHVDGRFVLTPDLWLVGTGVGGELDSKRHHGDQEALDRTLDRHARADAHGLTLVHRSPARLRADPTGFVDELRRRVAECPPPAGLVVVPRGPLLPRAARP